MVEFAQKNKHPTLRIKQCEGGMPSELDKECQGHFTTPCKLLYSQNLCLSNSKSKNFGKIQINFI